MEPLLKYLETAAIDNPIGAQQAQETQRCITADYLSLSKAFQELSQHLENVDKINNDGEIEKVEEVNNQYDKFEKILINTSYLQNISEDVIYKAYGNAIRRNHSRDFEDFNQYHRDAYMRLKLRDLPYGAPERST